MHLITYIIIFLLSSLSFGSSKNKIYMLYIGWMEIASFIMMCHLYKRAIIIIKIDDKNIKTI